MSACPWDSIRQEVGPGLVHGGHDLFLPSRPPGPVTDRPHEPQQHRRPLAHALHLFQLLLRGGQHPVQGPELVQKPVGGFVGIPAGDGIKQGQLQQLVVRHALRSMGQKLLALPLAVSIVQAHFLSPLFPALSQYISALYHIFPVFTSTAPAPFTAGRKCAIMA